MALFSERKRMPYFRRDALLLAAGTGDEDLTDTPLLQLRHHVTQHYTLQKCLHSDSATCGLGDRRNDLTRNSLETRWAETYAARVLTFSRGPRHSCLPSSPLRQGKTNTSPQPGPCDRLDQTAPLGNGHYCCRNATTGLPVPPT
jgi:hypothetical protein